ncbi:hypothetical protein P152DRAFT_476231 [Eremomyces bilateralis CBS 781.70]|uniref:VOC domain-containing protein n=1 Tax=Eremomyces bilateralis CBS 781.70 TaxID=1392243 RepID=A0A6G1FVY0_9PEZI|nr:uncharacterized protein P152DRAFT_476231 [Eremomyces bilateralis CBS 781.70]KAF1809831.1 hypothetical protein P152DRAFT_476231 [Eremomyces bilateralis CBS 781.70]
MSSQEDSSPKEPKSGSEWEIPPIGTPCWIEIPARDVTKCKEFYATLFPEWEWRSTDTTTKTEQTTASFSFKKQSLTGGIVKVQEIWNTSGAQPGGMGYVVYHIVDSIDIAVEKIQSIGGKQILEKKPESDFGFYAKCKDVEGNIFGIYEVKR